MFIAQPPSLHGKTFRITTVPNG